MFARRIFGISDSQVGKKLWRREWESFRQHHETPNKDWGFQHNLY
jgi:hypothetical protein